MPVKVFFDGGCRPNPGAMELAVVARGRALVRHDLGDGTSFDAEWLALIEALRVALTLDAPEIVLLGDAATVIAQANGRMKCRGVAIAHRATFRALLPPGLAPRVRYIKREQNLAGIALARRRLA